MKAVQLLPLILSFAIHASAQTAPAPVWTMQESGTTAGLRGIFSVDGTVAWASGTEGTVLRTIDGGAHWTRCSTPDADTDGATLDFRGVQAWDEKSAIVMASGPGDKSRLYKTEDGCGTWKLIVKNPDKDGFWDVVVSPRETYGDTKLPGYTLLIGDPIHGNFDARDGTALSPGIDWEPTLIHCQAKPDESVFAASNSSVYVSAFESFILGTGGKSGTRILISPGQLHIMRIDSNGCLGVSVPIAGGTDSTGIFSLGFRNVIAYNGIAVGGDYSKPSDSVGTAAWTADGGQHWTASTTPPHGYRSAVQWSESLKLWITAGTNGSDLSRDDGKTWQSLDNGNWNALSLPFVVGPGGRIAKLNAAALPKP